MAKTLNMRFALDNGRTTAMSLAAPKEDLTREQVEPVMQMVVDTSAADRGRVFVVCNLLDGIQRRIEGRERAYVANAIARLNNIDNARFCHAKRGTVLLALFDVSVKDDGERVITLELPAAARKLLRRSRCSNLPQRRKFFVKRAYFALCDQNALLRRRQRRQRPQMVANCR